MATGGRRRVQGEGRFATGRRTLTRRWRRPPALLGFVGLLLACATWTTMSRNAQGEPKVDFDAQIAPLLARRCLECHNASDKKGGLDLTTQAGARRGGESGSALTAGDPAASPLWERVEAGDMPPKRPLAADEKSLLERWIRGGGAWGVDPIDPFKYSSDRRGGYDWWAFQPLRQAPMPAIAGAATPIDALLDAARSAQGLAPSPLAEPRVLARRVYFDLLGLPPEIERLDDFEAEVAGGAPDAYERLVDRLLASPALGERWARHWLDVAHFGESDGFEYDRLRPNAWPYRDWVIRAFNQDLPYDEFTRLQIAGDVLRPDDPDAVAATGFLVGGAFDGLTPAGEVMRLVMRQDEMEDLVATFSQTFLGLTVHCGRCHDHKFDPIPQVDYYRLASSLAGVRRGERPIPATSDTTAQERRIEELTRQLRELEEPARRAVLVRRSGADKTPRESPPTPIAAWDFTRDLRDRIGGMQAELRGGARQDAQGLHVDGKQAHAVTKPLEKSLGAKTLAAVVKLANLTQQGGGVVSLQTLDGNLFDAIVFGEREAGRWMAGSNGFARTRPFQGPEETKAATTPVHVAWVYDAQGNITGYVGGVQYGQPYRAMLQPFEAGQTQAVFGLRHAPVGGNRMLAGTLLRAALYDRALTAEEVSRAAAAESDFVSEAELAAELGEAGRGRRQGLLAQAGALRDAVQRAKSGRVFAITPQPPPATHLLVRGNPQQPRELVAPGAITVASLDGRALFPLSPEVDDASRRRALAEWLTQSQVPLYLRTIANRLWHYHYGSGLVATPNDLGFSGGKPSHPELLDWLANETARRGYSLKRLHRELVTTRAYRQSSAPREEARRSDADNRLLWRMNPRRLEAEAVRDAMLAVSGQLNRQMGGPGYQDFRPFLRGGTQFYEPLDPAGAAFQRRSVYRTWARGGHNRLLDTFDCPDPSTSTPKRSVTTTPLQALALLNNSFVLRTAEALAEEAQRGESPQSETPQAEPNASAAQIVQRMFALTYGRRPQAEEERASVAFLKRHGAAALARVLLNANAFVYVD